MDWQLSSRPFLNRPPSPEPGRADLLVGLDAQQRVPTSVQGFNARGFAWEKSLNRLGQPPSCRGCGKQNGGPWWTHRIQTPRTRHPSHTGRTLSGHARRPKRPRGVHSACAARWKSRCRQIQHLPARNAAWPRVGIARAGGSLSGFRRPRCGEGGSCGPGIESLWRSGSSAAKKSFAALLSANPVPFSAAGIRGRRLRVCANSNKLRLFGESWTTMMNLSTKAASIWSAVTCHHFSCFGDSVAKAGPPSAARDTWTASFPPRRQVACQKR
jgi:hypothetical protein